jgi:hypothetical protein
MAVKILHTEGGAFHIARSIFSNGVWQYPDKFRLFFYLIGHARFSHELRKFGDVSVGYGQFLRSYRCIAEDCSYVEKSSLKQWSPSKVSRMVAELEAEGRITTQDMEGLGTLFTVCNYKEYQALRNYKVGGLEQMRNNNNNDIRIINDPLFILAQSVIENIQDEVALSNVLSGLKKDLGETELQRILEYCKLSGKRFESEDRLISYLKTCKQNGVSSRKAGRKDMGQMGDRAPNRLPWIDNKKNVYK